MDKKITALKTSSKVLSVITKIGYTVMIVAVCICTALAIFLAVTGGKIAALTIGGVNLIFFDKLASTPAELTAMCIVLVVTSGIFLATFLLAHRMFNEISKTGNPFKESYVKVFRAIGIIVAAMPIAVGITQTIVTVFTGINMPEMFSDLPSILIGAIIFCLSYTIDYGCGLSKTLPTDTEATTEK